VDGTRFVPAHPQSSLKFPRFSGHVFKQNMSKTEGGFYGQKAKS
jgi:hypothetical protein